LSNSDFDKNGIDSYGIHWLQYAAFTVSSFAIFTTWAFFFDERLHASWIHLHLPSSPEVAKNFIDTTQINFSKHS